MNVSWKVDPASKPSAGEVDLSRYGHSVPGNAVSVPGNVKCESPDCILARSWVVGRVVSFYRWENWSSEWEFLLVGSVPRAWTNLAWLAECFFRKHSAIAQYLLMEGHGYNFKGGPDRRDTVVDLSEDLKVVFWCSRNSGHNCRVCWGDAGFPQLSGDMDWKRVSLRESWSDLPYGSWISYLSMMQEGSDFPFLPITETLGD